MFSIVFAPYSIDMHVLDTVWMVRVNFYQANDLLLIFAPWGVWMEGKYECG
jgi:hypothetical protein